MDIEIIGQDSKVVKAVKNKIERKGFTVQENSERNWLPLESVMMERHGDKGFCSDYMFMGMHDKIYMYKNKDSRRYLLIDDDLNFYENYNRKCTEEKAFMLATC